MRFLMMFLVLMVIFISCKRIQDEYRIELIGNNGDSFSGVCEGTDHYGERLILEIDGDIPYSKKIEARYLNCFFQKDNNLNDFEINFYKDKKLIYNEYNNNRYAILHTHY